MAAATSTPGALVAPAYTARALAQRHLFLRSAAAAWAKAGDASAASRLTAAADELAARHDHAIAQGEIL